MEQVAEAPAQTIDREALRKDPYFREFCRAAYALIYADRKRKGTLPASWPEPKTETGAGR